MHNKCFMKIYRSIYKFFLHFWWWKMDYFYYIQSVFNCICEFNVCVCVWMFNNQCFNPLSFPRYTSIFPCALFIWLQPNCLKAWEIKIIAFSPNERKNRQFSLKPYFPRILVEFSLNKKTTFKKMELLSFIFLFFCKESVGEMGKYLARQASKDKKMIYWLAKCSLFIFVFSFNSPTRKKKNISMQHTVRNCVIVSSIRKDVSFAFNSLKWKTLWRQTLKWVTFSYFFFWCFVTYVVDLCASLLLKIDRDVKHKT